VEVTESLFVKVVEFANYGSLETSFNHHTVERLCKFTIQAATALEHLEKKEVIHHAVTVFNCLVVADFQVNTVGELFVDLSRFLSSLRFDWLQVTLSRQQNKKTKKTKNKTELDKLNLLEYQLSDQLYIDRLTVT